MGALEDPELVADGADVLTTNSYSTFDNRLGPFGLADRAKELTQLSGNLARAAADAADSAATVPTGPAPIRMMFGFCDISGRPFNHANRGSGCDRRADVDKDVDDLASDWSWQVDINFVSGGDHQRLPFDDYLAQHDLP